MNWMNRTKLSELSDDELVKYLENKNNWYQRTAQRLLYQRKSNAIKAIQQVATTSTSAVGRVHAMWLLNGLNALDEQTLYENLEYTHPNVRENAIKISDMQALSQSIMPEGLEQTITVEEMRDLLGYLKK
jgi:hypothetical protein